MSTKAIEWARSCGMALSTSGGNINVDACCLSRLIEQRDGLLKTLRSVEAGNLDGETYEDFHERVRTEARNALR